MAKTLAGYAAAGRSVFFQLGLVKTHPPSHIFIAEVTLVESFNGPGLQKPVSPVIASLQVHLHDLGHVIGIAEQAGMSSYPALHRRPHIVHITLHSLVAVVIVLLRGNDAFLVEEVQWLEAGIVCSKGLVKFLGNDAVQGFSQGVLYEFFHHVVGHIAVTVAVGFQGLPADAIVDGIPVGIREVEILSDLDGIARSRTIAVKFTRRFAVLVQGSQVKSDPGRKVV